MDLENMSKDALEKCLINSENEYQLALKSLNTIELQDIDISKKITELQLSRKNIASGLTMAKYNLRRISSDLRNIKTYIYKRLGGN